MREELRMVNWDELLDGNIHEAWEKFRDRLESLERKYIPVKTVARRKPLWITVKAIEAVRKKRRAYIYIRGIEISASTLRVWWRTGGRQ